MLILATVSFVYNFFWGKFYYTTSVLVTSPEWLQICMDVFVIIYATVYFTWNILSPTLDKFGMVFGECSSNLLFLFLRNKYF